MSSNPEAENSIAAKAQSEALTFLSREFHFGIGQFSIRRTGAVYPLEKDYLEETLVTLAMAEAYLRGLIRLQPIGITRITRLIGVLESVLAESTSVSTENPA